MNPPSSPTLKTAGHCLKTPGPRPSNYLFRSWIRCISDGSCCSGHFRPRILLERSGIQSLAPSIWRNTSACTHGTVNITLPTSHHCASAWDGGKDQKTSGITRGPGSMAQNLFRRKSASGPSATCRSSFRAGGERRCEILHDPRSPLTFGLVMHKLRV
jgi:hypothetical protein